MAMSGLACSTCLNAAAAWAGVTPDIGTRWNWTFWPQTPPVALSFFKANWRPFWKSLPAAGSSPLRSHIPTIFNGREK